MKRVKWNTESFKEYCNRLHFYKYDYNLLSYTSLHDTIEIICPKHGLFKQLANHHKNGHGCKKCAMEKKEEIQRDSTNSFIIKSLKKHGQKYNYSKTIYGKNAHEKVIITCNIHGDFYQSPNAHLTNNGCRKCGQEKSVEKLKENGFHSWSKSNWKKICEGKEIKLYVIELFSTKEKFYKIGVTSKTLIKRRFTKIPYQYRILKIVQSKDSDYIFNLERRFLKLTKNRKYIPEHKFAGYTECRKELNINAECH